MGPHPNVPPRLSKRLFRQPSNVVGVGRAFSLIELLIAIAVIGVLLALALPALFRSRAAARAIQSAANVRTLQQVLFAYASDSREGLPVTDETKFYPTDNYELTIKYPYWQIHQTWTGVVFSYLPYDQNLTTYICPGSVRLKPLADHWPSSYHYSKSFAGDPRLWQPGAAKNLSLQRGMRTTDVRFASQKAMLWDWELSYIGGRVPLADGIDIATPTPMGFADCSVSPHTPSLGAAAAINPLDPYPRRLDNTPDGVQGVDY